MVKNKKELISLYVDDDEDEDTIDIVDDEVEGEDLDHKEVTM